MKRTITTLALAASMMLLAIPAASATHVDETKDHGYDESEDTAGALKEGEDGECRPGAQENVLVGSWTLMRIETYIADVEALVTQRYLDGEYGDMTPAEFQERFDAIPERADATWTFCDKDRDTLLCVLRTDPSPYWYTLLDNRPFPGS